MAQAAALRQSGSPTAADQIRALYEQQPVTTLSGITKDPIAVSVLAQRFSADPALEKIISSDYRSPHEATYKVTETDNSLVTSGKLASGGVTQDERLNRLARSWPA